MNCNINSDDGNGNGVLKKTAIIGGTFNALHQGHRDYIRLAFDFADEIFILLTNTKYANIFKNYKVHSYQYRKTKLEQFIKQINDDKEYSIYPMDSEQYLIKFCLTRDITMAVIIPENYLLFERINRLREQEGKPSMLLLVKQRTKTKEGFDINSTIINNIHDTINYSPELYKYNSPLNSKLNLQK